MMTTKTKHKWDIPQLPMANYEVDVPWDHLEKHLEKLAERAVGGFIDNPDYQRAHVWTRAQQVAYVEYILIGGEVGKSITLNCPDWMRGSRSPVELVDGKQRLEAVRSFLRGEFPAYGMLAEPDDRFDLRVSFRFRVCCLKTRVEVLRRST